ncbi:POU domain, class 3, transcription factor 2-like [Eutrema salsugineum]|uniref:POU domain, class 3, transcription factor 2-like n=1 Tax=Eutrema salsugineum TaxID=72664 RepID=UPI000CED2CD8|nr:POU domain, class 3, transcription factor 2-like [Eutrema salsugineum]
MPGTGKKRGRGRGGGGGGGRGGGRGGASPSHARTPSPLPNRYDFTPERTSKSPPPLVPTCPPSVSVRDYPRPNQLFQHSQSQRQSSDSQPVNSPWSQPRTSPPPQPVNSTHSHHRPSPMSEEQTSPKCEAHNSQAGERATFEEEEDLFPANLAENQMRILNAFLTQPECNWESNGD